MDQLTIYAAKYLIVVPVLAALAVLAWRLHKQRDWRFLALLIIGAIISLVLAKIGNHFISDPRPFVQGHFTPLVPHAPDNGFPSDHTLLAAFLAFAVMTVRRWWGWALVGVAILLGLARMNAGVHHSWDILGSFACALIGTAIAVWLLNHFWPKTKTASTD
jgi:undecaprenyl-diphosphatase